MRPDSGFNVPAPAGFLVKTVAEGSMAWNMGLQGGDGIVTIAGKEIPVGGDIILSVDGIPVVSEDNIACSAAARSSICRARWNRFRAPA